MRNRQFDMTKTQATEREADLIETTLQQLVAKSGVRHQLSTGTGQTKTGQSLLRGKFLLQRQFTGVHFHAVDAQELEDGYSEITLHPCFSFTLLLQGNLGFELGTKAYQFDAKNEALCFAIHCRKPVQLRRQLQRGRKIRKVNVSVSHDWLAAHLDESFSEDRGLKIFLQQHFSVLNWQPSARLRQLGGALMESSQSNGVMQSLLVESKAIEFILECLQSIAGFCPQPSSDKNVEPINTAINLKAQKIKQFINETVLGKEGHQYLGEFELRGIAKQVGMSVSNLQRTFKQAYGQTVIEYVRGQRMQKALLALESGETTIGEAAFIAGYKHTSNFALAFKKSFGFAPGSFTRS